MAGVSSASVELRDVAIVGGGCYGSFYARQLVRAQETGRARIRHLLVVDRDPACRFAREIGPTPARQLVTAEWDEFFDRWLGPDRASRPGEPTDAIVPSPLMPHLMFQWLLRRARARWPGRSIEPAPVPLGPGTPYDETAADGTRYVSFADWLCPTHCIEPATCPVIGAPRTWEMAEAMERLTQRLDVTRPTAGPVLFLCRHRVFGVGMFDTGRVLAGDAQVAEAGVGGRVTDVLVGTISACHGAVSLLRLG